jgi:hypothetical protein
MFQCQNALPDGKEKDSGMSWAPLQNAMLMLTSESDPRFVRPRPRRSSIGENVAKADTSARAETRLERSHKRVHSPFQYLNKFSQRGALTHL